MRSAPQIIDVNDAQLEEVLRRVEQSLDEKDVTLIRAVFQSYLYAAGNAATAAAWVCGFAALAAARP